LKNIFACPLRVEPAYTTSEEQDIQAKKLIPIQVVHGTRDSTFFGHPFFLLVERDETMFLIKQRIEKKLKLPKAEWHKWRFYQYDLQSHRPSFLRDDAMLDWSKEQSCLLAEHPDPHASPATQSRRHQPLHIR